MPVCLKDLMYTRGIRTTAGSKILCDFVPDADAEAASRLFAAGAILIGKNNLHEFAYGATNLNPHYGPVHNPWALERMSGGSSGGSAAAVAAGLALAALGTDTGGSIRIPSAACGCVGLKPTHGRVPVAGVIPLAPSLDHIGPICRCVEDAALVFEAIADPLPGAANPARAMKRGLRGLRIGIPQQFFFDRLQAGVRRNVTAAIAVLERNGAAIREVKLKHLDETARLAGDLTVSEALLYHSKWMNARSADYGADLRLRLDEGRKMSALAYLEACELRREYTRGFASVLESVDILAVPTLPVAAPRIDESEVRIGRSSENVRMALLRFTRPANLACLPAISVPCGFTSERLPTGLQLIGRAMDEATVLRAARAYESLTPWHEAFPPE
jgi:aspartyl-tRNA(Asn)/glutamyl-tRNA(Gln) amidotransferase subunit A